jgi:hypothetical protein
VFEGNSLARELTRVDPRRYSISRYSRTALRGNSLGRELYKGTPASILDQAQDPAEAEEMDRRSSTTAD